MIRLNIDRHSGAAGLFERLLIKLSITELPQLWNVLRGEMSLVGPRPESPERVKRYSEWQKQRLSVKPGMTGLAQVHGLREQHSSEEKTRFDLQYLLDRSFLADVSLLFQTAWTLAMRVIRFSRLVTPVQDILVARLVTQPNSELTKESPSGAYRAQSSSD
jgi:hypothetical protein